MEEKLCKICGETKPFSDFNKDRTTKSGITRYCRECDKARRRVWEQNNFEKRQKYYKERYYEGREIPPGRTRILTGTAKSRRRDWMRLWQRKPEEREKAAARGKVNLALKQGLLVRKSCEVCEKPKTHAHHDDYSKPLEVRWVCPLHHSKIHLELKYGHA